MGRVRASRTRRLPTPASGDTPFRIWWRPLLIVIAGTAAYSNSLSGPFIFDDMLAIVGNAGIREWWHLAAVMAPERELPVAGRPLVNLSFAVNYALDGLRPFGYHLVNVALHLLCALLIFGIVRRTLELPRLKTRCGRWAPDVACAAALLWTLHPLNTEAVTYVTQRTELMMALFYLLTLYAGIRAWPFAGVSRWQAIAVASCAAGMASKESMATAPLMLVIYDSTFLFGSLRQAIRSRWRLYTAVALSWLVLIAVTWSGPRVHSAGFSTPVSPWTYLLNQTIMITEYLRLAVWPHPLVLYYGRPLPLSLGDVMPYALLVTALVMVTILLLVYQPTWGFLGLWFFVTLAPTSSLVPIATEVGAERRMYLPLIALIVLVVVGTSFVKRLSPIVATVMLVICAAGLAAGTWARNREYSSGLRLAQTVVARHPTSGGHHLLGVALMDAGQVDDALLHLRQAVPEVPRAYYPLGVAWFKQGDTAEAIAALEAFVRAEPGLLEAVSARQLLGQALTKQHRWEPAIEQYQMVLRMNPSSAQRIQTQFLLGAALVGAQRFTEAAAQYVEYLQVDPNNGVALTNLGVALVATHRPDEALEVFRRAVAANPNDSESQRNLASALLEHNQFIEATGHAERAVALQPNDAAAHDVLGRALVAQGRWADARRQFEQALQIAPDDTDARDDLASLQRLVTGR